MPAALEQQLADAERDARVLEGSPQQRTEWTQQVVSSGLHYLNDVAELPAFIDPNPAQPPVRALRIADEGHALPDVLQFLRPAVIDPGLAPASGGHLGYIPGGGLYLSALGDYLADVTNKYAGIHFAAPGAVAMENMLLEWMAGVFGFPTSFAGNLTSGGSLANLIAIVTARDAHGVDSQNIRRKVIYGSAHMHHCLNKAIRIAGLNECVYREVPLDARHRMDTGRLKELVRADVNAGLEPFLLIGSAGTTDCGAIDPLRDMADVAADAGCWFHIDAAYGGFFMLLDEEKPKFAGIERADSLVIDPHKGLFLPYGTGAVLVRNGDLLRQSHYYQANYMQDALTNTEEMSPADLSPELTKPFRGLRLWLPLMVHGVAPFKACLREKLLLTHYFRQRLREIPGMVAGHEPDLSVTWYCLHTGHARQDDMNLHLAALIRQDGRVFVSTSRIDGMVQLRLAVLSFRTHRSTIDTLVDVLKEKVPLALDAFR
jgi:glutamate/tyrosine decarboxylase-like PLP-dependent enzyme